MWVSFFFFWLCKNQIYFVSLSLSFSSSTVGSTLLTLAKAEQSSSEERRRVHGVDQPLSKDVTGLEPSFRPGRGLLSASLHWYQAPDCFLWNPLHFLTPGKSASSGGVGQGHTRMDGLVAGEVALVAEGGLAAVTLVGFVTVRLQCVPLERGFLREAAVTLIAEEGPVLCQRVGGDTNVSGSKRDGAPRPLTSIATPVPLPTQHTWEPRAKGLWRFSFS